MEPVCDLSFHTMLFHLICMPAKSKVTLMAKGVVLTRKSLFKPKKNAVKKLNLTRILKIPFYVKMFCKIVKV